MQGIVCAGTMGNVGFPSKLSACILIFLILENFCVTCDDHWCYEDPECDPATWGPIGSCSGMRQSPININPQTVKPKSTLGPIHFKKYEDLKIAKIIKNTGHHCQIDFKPVATISGTSFSATYYLRQVHFHWGTQNSDGAEHTIDGKRHTMEMHLVHTKNNMSIEDALKLPDGLVVLAFLMEKTEGNNQITPWNTLANILVNIPEKGDSYNLNGEFSVGGLLSKADVSHYYYYQGSLTTPPCTESVIWFVFEIPLQISNQVADIMTTSLYYTTVQENKLMQNNFRPTQALNNRSVYYYTEYKSLLTCMAHCLAPLF
ncbi:carbonic anhydrase 4-like [Thamnophis elegans]|uniref:carbonic anhydrase 4-like n=1 Tax=Thamnophis elegans TaxID=35005 RepID=UPI001377C125|nr:carbonic anhydrase 4-like [Thamnophis elegans]